MNKDIEYRGYFFTNYYLSSLQQGLQAAHCLGNMFVKYNDFPWDNMKDVAQMLYDWASSHKTIIILNGGNSQDIKNLYNELFDYSMDLRFPLAMSAEDEKSLNNATTCVGIVIPDTIYDIAYGEYDSVTITDNERKQLKLQALVNRYHLAR